MVGKPGGEEEEVCYKEASQHGLCPIPGHPPHGRETGNISIELRKMPSLGPEHERELKSLMKEPANGEEAKA